MVAKTVEVYHSSMETPVGRLLLASTVNGLCRISFESEGEEGFFSWIEDKFPGSVLKKVPSKNREYVNSLRKYFSGGLRSFDLKLDLIAAGFQKVVLQKLAKVPYGKTISYGKLAAKAGSPRAARAAGTACARNPLPIVIPCHRVITAGGTLGGFGDGLDVKRYLLRHEGIEIDGENS